MHGAHIKTISNRRNVIDEKKILDAACEDAWKRLLRLSLIREVRKDMRENAHKDAIRCFAGQCAEFVNDQAILWT